MKKKSFFSPDDSTLVIILKNLFGILVMVPFLFLPAGTLNWPEGWLFTFILLCYAIGASLYSKKHNPELLKNRTEMELPPKLWDKVILGLIAVSFTAVFIIAPLDAVRYGWSVVPLWLKAAGFLGFASSLAGVFWILKENATLFTSVKVTKEQKVVSTGPYGIIRHPMYAFSCFMSVCIPLSLGSYYALIPAAIFIAVLVVRTGLEDKELHKELKGYKEYAKKVRCRLIPGIW